MKLINISFVKFAFSLADVVGFVFDILEIAVSLTDWCFILFVSVTRVIAIWLDLL